MDSIRIDVEKMKLPNVQLTYLNPSNPTVTKKRIKSIYHLCLPTTSPKKYLFNMPIYFSLFNNPINYQRSSNTYHQIHYPPTLISKLLNYGKLSQPFNRQCVNPYQ